MVPDNFVKSIIMKHRNILVDEIASNDKGEDAEKSIKRTRTRLMIRDIFKSSYEHYPQEYVDHIKIYSTKKRAGFTKLTEAQLRSAIQSAKNHFLKDGLLLSNKPVVGYRLTRTDDIAYEMGKGFIRACYPLNSILKIYIYTKEQHESLDFESVELINEINNVTARVIAWMQSVSNDLKFNKQFLKSLESLKELKTHVDNISDGGKGDI